MNEGKVSIKQWQDLFGTSPMKIIPNPSKLEKSWSEMGRVFGQIQLQKQKYKRAGLAESAKEIEKKMDEEKKKLEESTIDLMGYPRLRPNAKADLQKSASADGLHLNIYQLEEYAKIPPLNIANAIMEARQYFDRIEIWAIEETAYVRPIKDPAVIGYVKIGYQDTPYLIATWGEDIKPEDLADIDREIEEIHEVRSIVK